MADPATPTPTTPSTPAAPAPEAPAPQPPATPASQTPGQPTEGAPAAPEGPKEPPRATNVREAKQQLRRGGDRYPSTAAEAKAALGKGEHHAQNQPRAEDGKFAAQEAQTPSAAPEAPDPNASAADAPDATPPAEGAAPAPPAEPAAPTDATDSVPEGTARVPVPEGHPWRDRGREFIDVPKDDADYHRWALNNAVRREHVSQWEQHAKGVESENRRLKAELQATREFAGGIFQDPAVLQQIEDIRNTYGDDAAKRFEAGLWQEQQAKVQEHTQKQEAEALHAENVQTTTRFVRDVLRTAAKRYPEWVQGWPPVEQMSDAQIGALLPNSPIGNAIGAYGAHLAAAGSNRPDIQKFLEMTDPVFVRDPRAKERLEARRNQRLEQERQNAAKKEADRLAAEERKKLEEAATKRAQYPWMNVPAGAVPAQVGVDEGAGGPRNVHEARRSLSRIGRAGRA